MRRDDAGPRARGVRVDLHLHTNASFDCSVDPRLVWYRCSELGLSPIFVTDHDTIAGAQLLQQSASCQVVCGQEVSTRDGELIGLFLNDAVEAGSSASETAAAIKEQGGLVLLPHPCDSSRASVQPDVIDRIAEYIDIVEVFNGRASASANHLAAELCWSLGAKPGAGSDAHTLTALGRVYVEIAQFDDAQDFFEKLAWARIVSNGSPLRLRLDAALQKLVGRSRG